MEEIRLTTWGNCSLSHEIQGFSTIPGGDHQISEPPTEYVWINGC